MKLQNNLWLEGSFYVDIDTLGQLRVVGPGNHLFYGSNGLYAPDFQVNEVVCEKGQLRLVVSISTDGELTLKDPVTAHIRRVRQHCEIAGQPVPPYQQVGDRHPQDLLPNLVSVDGNIVTYHRRYGKEWYGVRMIFPLDSEIHRDEAARAIVVRSSGPELEVLIETDSSIIWRPGLERVIAPQHLRLPDDQFQLMRRAEVEIDHLVRTNKTSGFEYGTVFPRDWLESINLGQTDFTPEALRYMFHQSLEHVDDQGSGWHETLVGEFRSEREEELDQVSQMIKELLAEQSTQAAFTKALSELHRHQVSRHMIDIEPLYLLTLRLLDPALLSAEDIRRLRQVARYVVTRATEHDLITFKEMPSILRRHRHDRYFHDGNWRDSEFAYQGIRSNIAPYDVNAVFYPEALRQMKQFAELLQVDPAELDAAIAKWSRVKDHYRFTNADGTTAYALAIYDVEDFANQRYQRLLINHLDESYDLFYGSPEPADVESFCLRLLNPDYFFTPSGPTLVGKHQGYNHTHYHGEVIWTKQTAFTVAGLSRQLDRAKKAKWDERLSELIQRALQQTAEASLTAFTALGAVPELHYDLKGEPHLYNDLPDAEGVMNLVQLWSAVGVRRIIRAYSELLLSTQPPGVLGAVTEHQHQDAHQPSRQG